MCRISGDDEGSSFLRLSDEGGKAAAGGGLTNSSLAADEDPSQRFLIEDVLQGGCELQLHGGVILKWDDRLYSYLEFSFNNGGKSAQAAHLGGRGGRGPREPRL